MGLLWDVAVRPNLSCCENLNGKVAPAGASSGQSLLAQLWLWSRAMGTGKSTPETTPQIFLITPGPAQDSEGCGFPLGGIFGVWSPARIGLKISD